MLSQTSGISEDQPQGACDVPCHVMVPMLANWVLGLLAKYITTWLVVIC